MNKPADTYTFVHTLTKKKLKGTSPFHSSEFSGAHCINPTYCRYILQSQHEHCKGYRIPLGTGSYIIGQKDEMNSVPCLKEFTIRLCNVSFQQKLYGREMGPNISFKIDGEKRCKTL